MEQNLEAHNENQEYSIENTNLNVLNRHNSKLQIIGLERRMDRH